MSVRPTDPRRLARCAATLLVGVGAGLGLLAPLPAASAAPCSGDSGVTVVVDFAELGGGLTAGCDPDVEDERARAMLADAGYSLTMATKSPGFVCRVNGLPADDPCVDAAPPDRYWSVWWADGDGGSWVYSSRGVDSLRVPDGGYLAMAWHQGNGKAEPPATVPAARTATAPQGPAPTVTPAPGTDKKAPRTAPRSGGTATPAPTVAPTGVPGEPTAGPSATSGPTPTASDTPTPGESVAVDPGLPAADEITLGPDDAAPTAAESSDGLPGWVVPVVLVVLVTAGALVVLRRRQA